MRTTIPTSVIALPLVEPAMMSEKRKRVHVYLLLSPSFKENIKISYELFSSKK